MSYSSYMLLSQGFELAINLFGMPREEALFSLSFFFNETKLRLVLTFLEH